MPSINNDRSSDRNRLRYILAGIILATLPCYCLGLIALSLAPQRSALLTGTPTQTPSLTWTAEPSATASPTPSPTITFTASPTTTGTQTASPQPTATNTPTATVTETTVPSDTPTETPTETPIPTDTASPSPSPSQEPSPTQEQTLIPIPFTDTTNLTSSGTPVDVTPQALVNSKP